MTGELLFPRLFKKTNEPWRPNYVVGDPQFVKPSSVAWSSNYGSQAKSSRAFVFVRSASLECSLYFVVIFFEITRLFGDM